MSRHDYLPFGEEISAGVGGRTAEQFFVLNPTFTRRFAGKERDEETGLDYSVARYYSAEMGRFTSADLPFIDQDLSDPQSWNLYTYVRNNPLVLVDPSGRTCIWNAQAGKWNDVGSGQTCSDVDANPVGDSTTASGDGAGTDSIPSDPQRGPGGGSGSPARQWIFANPFQTWQRAICVGGWALGGGIAGGILGAGAGGLAGGVAGGGVGSFAGPVGTLGGGAVGGLGGAQAGAILGGVAGFGGGAIAGNILCSSGSGSGGGGSATSTYSDSTRGIR